MKKFLVVSLAAAAVLFILSCGSDKKEEENKNDAAEQSDSDAADTGKTSSDKGSETPDDADETDSDAPADTGDTGSDDDTSSDDADTAGDSGKDADTAADNDVEPDDPGDSQPDSDTDEDTGEQDPDSEFTVNENLQPVPPEQNNNAGDTCDKDTFVEFCDGELVVFCRESRVVRSSCGAGEACIATVGLYDEYGNRNYADCYEKCSQAGEKSTTCRQNKYYSGDSTKTLTIGTLKHDLCMKTSKGNLLFEDSNRTTKEICDSPCKDSKSCAGLAEIPADQKNGTNDECDPDTSGILRRKQQRFLLCRESHPHQLFGNEQYLPYGIRYLRHKSG